MVTRKLVYMSIPTLLILTLFLPGCIQYIDYREEMRLFVENISKYAKNHDPNFIVIPQNGIELVTEDGEPNGNLSVAYIESIDGVGQESLFYGYEEDNKPTPQEEQIRLIGFLDRMEENGVEVLVTDYCWAHSYVDDSYKRCSQHSYISFAADHRELDNIPSYPEKPYNENNQDILRLSDAKNFLYLINPDKYSSKEEFLESLRHTNYDLLIIDLFYGNTSLTAEEVNSLKTKMNGSLRLVISYMSIGEAEDYRYYWNDSWYTNPPDWLDKENPDWPRCYKVRYWYPEWQQIIYGNNESYMKKILDAGFDGVYLDVIDAFEYFEEKKSMRK